MWLVYITGGLSEGVINFLAVPCQILINVPNDNNGTNAPNGFSLRMSGPPVSAVVPGRLRSTCEDSQGSPQVPSPGDAGAPGDKCSDGMVSRSQRHCGPLDSLQVMTADLFTSPWTFQPPSVKPKITFKRVPPVQTSWKIQHLFRCHFGKFQAFGPDHNKVWHYTAFPI